MRHRHLLLVPLVLALLCASSAARAGGGSPSLVIASCTPPAATAARRSRTTTSSSSTAARSSVDLTGWTVQYASAASTSWSATTAVRDDRARSRVPRAARLRRRERSARCRRRTRPARRTSPRPAARSRSSTTRPRSPAARPQAPAPAWRRSPTSSATALPPTSKAPTLRLLPTRRRRSSVRPAAAPTPTRTRADFSAHYAAAPINSSAAASPCSGGGGSVVVLRECVRRVQVAAGDLGLARPADARLRQPRRRCDDAAGHRERDGHVATTSAGYTLTAHRRRSRRATCRSASRRRRPRAASLGAGISPTALTSLPIAPAPDLTIGSTSAARPAAGDVWATQIGFTGPLPSGPRRAVHGNRHLHGDPALTMRALLLVAASPSRGAPASAGAPRRSGLIVWPARATVVAGSSATLHVANHTRRPVARRCDVAASLSTCAAAPQARRARRPARRSSPCGRPRVVVAPGAVGSVARARSLGRGLASGDHPALVLLTARSAGGAGIGVRVRIGVPVEVRVAGRGPAPARARRAARSRAAARARSSVTAATSTSGSARGSVVVEVLAWVDGASPTLQPRPRDLFPRARWARRVPRSETAPREGAAACPGDRLPDPRRRSFLGRTLSRIRQTSGVATTEPRKQTSTGDVARGAVRRRPGAGRASSSRTISGIENEPLQTPETVQVDYERDLGYPGCVSVHARRLPVDVPRAALDDAAVRRLRHGGGDERALPVSARPRPDRAVDRVRHADADGLRLGSSRDRSARSGARASRSTRSRTWRRCSPASRSATCRRR